MEVALRSQKKEVYVRFDHEQFRRACRAVRQAELAPVIGIRVSNMSTKLKNVENIKIVDFLKICEYLNENPSRFFVEEDKA